jgi:sarcosine oxidase
MRRFPAFRLPPDYVAVVQPDGGYLLAEQATRAFADMARRAGADLRERVTVLDVKARPHGVDVVTDNGTIEAGSAVIAAGPWLKRLLPDLPADLRVTRQVVGWFEPREPALFAPDRFPVFILENAHGNHYGFPVRDAPPYSGLLKVARHNHGAQSVDPDRYDRAISPQDEASIRAALADHIPAGNGRLVRSGTCLYTQTEDLDFLIDRLPGAPQIVIASPCSGHGFKFAPVIGESLADMTIGETPADIARFGLSRFAHN